MIAWVDIETTGLDESEPHAKILEVGIVVTNDDLDVHCQSSHVIHVGPGGFPAMSEPVVNMHTANGLISEAMNDGETLRSAEIMLCKFLEFAEATGSPMAGSSVHFDRRWLQRHMPELESSFHYRNIDISAVRELARRWRPDLDDSKLFQRKKHRAIPDIEDTLTLARFYQQHLFNAPHQ